MLNLGSGQLCRLHPSNNSRAGKRRNAIYKKNEGTLDRIIRVSIAVIIGLLYLTGVIEGTAALVLGIVAIAMLITGIVGFCSLYVPFGISTRKKDSDLS